MSLEERRELDFLLHSTASAPEEDLQGRVADRSEAGCLLAMAISRWSFIRKAELAEPIVRNEGTSFCMTCRGSPMVAENNGIIGPVEAALGSATRYLAAELGPQGIRLHAISPDPFETRAASGLPRVRRALAQGS